MKKTKVRASATFIVARRAAISGLTCGPVNVMTTALSVARVICRRTRAKMKRSDRRYDKAGRGFSATGIDGTRRTVGTSLEPLSRSRPASVA
jgi:hypothetical protein